MTLAGKVNVTRKDTKKRGADKLARVTWPEYQAAVRAECVHEINTSPECWIRAALRCEIWTDAETARLRILAAGHYPHTVEPRAVEIYKNMRAALAEVTSYARSNEHATDPASRLVARIAVAAAPLREVPELVAQLPAFRPFGPQIVRDRLVWMMRCCFQMNIARDARPRDLALLSLLAGNFPDGPRKVFTSGAKRPTLADAIGDEVKAMRAAMTRAEKNGTTGIVVPVEVTPDGRQWFALPSLPGNGN